MTELEKAKQEETDGTKALIELINNAYLASGFVLAGDTENGKHLSDDLRRSINKVKKIFFVEEE